MRIVRLAVLIFALIPAAFLHAPKPLPSVVQMVRRADLLPAIRVARSASELGPFELVGAWHLTSEHKNFGNFSALVRDRAGSMIALGDRGGIMKFSPPDRPGRWRTQIGKLLSGDRSQRSLAYDAEAATLDPASGRLLVSYEGGAAMFDYPADLSRPTPIPLPVLLEWPDNQGPEAMTRLADGRTIILGEVYARWFNRRTHGGLLFRGKPRPFENPARFEIEMPEGLRPSELTQLPDGRVLVLGRTLSLQGFRTTISVFDPAEIRAGNKIMPRLLATISKPSIRENYEGMTAFRDADGSTVVWLISDSNHMVWAQRTILLKLRLKPAN
jgi:hypothetical protein